MAIAQVSSSYIGFAFPGTSVSGSFDCGTGADALLIGVVADDASDAITGATFDSVSASLGSKSTPVGGGGGRYAYIYYLLGPASGSKTVQVNAGSSVLIIVVVASYSGVAQVSQPDVAANNAVAFDTTLTTSFTTTTDNAWGFAVGSATARPQSSGTNASKVVEDSTFSGYCALFESGSLGAAGSKSMQTSQSAPSAYGHAVVVLKEAAGGGAGQPTMRRWGATPYVGGHGINAGGGGGRMWGRRQSGLIVPKRLQEAA